MDDPWRKLRGLAVLGTLWGLAWGAIGAVVGLVIAVVTGLGPALWLGPVLEWGLGIGAYGLLSGVAFGEVLWLLERRSTLDEVSLRRVASGSALGAALVPILFGLAGFFEPGTSLVDVAQAMVLTSLLGAASAGGTLAVARRGEIAGVERDAALAAGVAAEDRPLVPEPLPEALLPEGGGSSRIPRTASLPLDAPTEKGTARQETSPRERS